MFKRCFLLSAVFFSITHTVISQANDHYKKDSLKICGSPTYVVEPSNMLANIDQTQAVHAIPFSEILVKDVRLDTGYIGVINSKKFLSAKGFHKFRFNDKTETVLTRILNDPSRYSFTRDSYQLLCFLKQFRIMQMDSIAIEGKPKMLYTTAMIEIEAYLAINDSCYPVVGIDTTASSLDIEEKDFTVLADVLNAFVNKAALSDTAKILKKKSYSLGQTKERYDQRFNKHILRDPVLNRGVYTSNEEFVNNDPSVRDYEFNKEGILYTKIENNNWVPTRQAYGFCDGTRIWLNVNKVFRPLIRMGDTFEFLTDVKLPNETGARYKNNKIHIYRSPGMSLGEYSAMSATAGALLVLLNHYKNVPKFIYQLNLETGEFY